MTTYIFLFFIGFVLSYLFTLLFKFIAPKIGAIDMPNKRKVHKSPVARLGGIAIFISFFAIVFAVAPVGKQIIGLFLAGLILLLFGIIDDLKGMNSFTKLGGQFLAALVVVASGIGINIITNPFGGVIQLDTFLIPFKFGEMLFNINVWADLFTVFWIVMIINAINFLDGLDGLASGVSGIAAFILFLLSLSPEVSQPLTAILAIALSGVAFGFLPLNFFPARIFMGDSGSMFLGFMLAVLAIFSGGKIATALLILGLPILDEIWAIFRRLLKGNSPFKPDKHHLHHELLSRGLSQKKVVLIIYTFTLLFGVIALNIKSLQKFIALGAMITILVGAIGYLYFLDKKRDIKSS